MGEEQGGVSLAAIPLGEGLSGASLLPQTPQHPPTIPWGKRGSDSADTLWGHRGGKGLVLFQSSAQGRG